MNVSACNCAKPSAGTAKHSHSHPVQMAPRRLVMKVCLVGEAAVGKTALIQRFALDEVDDAYVQTLGSKVYKHELAVTHAGEAITLELAIWDIMGQKGFRELLKDAYFYGAHG